MLFGLGLPVALQSLVLTYLWGSTPASNLNQPDLGSITFHLRHEHATVANTARIVFSDFHPSTSTPLSDVNYGFSTEFTISTTKAKVPRPNSLAAFTAPRHSRVMGLTPPVSWDDWETIMPDVTKRSTLYTLAKMAANAYFSDNTTKEWYDLPSEPSGGGEWGSTPHGWEPSSDGLRGHIFVSSDNSTVVISLKGTSATWPVGEGGPTTTRDKLNDNMLFSCCCARVGPTWSTVCNCFEGGYRCDEDCVDEALRDEGLFYPIGLNLYNNVTYLYPNANIWITGHSLGGGLASLMGATFGAPVVAFEAPAERRAWQRLHLPNPPSTSHITHVYNSADPIPQGTCTGMASICAIGGFALETRCHTGQVILYDTVRKLGWSVDARNHPIKVVLEKLLADGADWKDEYNEAEGEGEGDGQESAERSGKEKTRWRWIPWPREKQEEGGDEEEDKPKRPLREVPRARPAVEVEGTDGVCTDCFNWEYGSFRNRTLTTGAAGLGKRRCHQV